MWWVIIFILLCLVFLATWVNYDEAQLVKKQQAVLEQIQQKTNERIHELELRLDNHRAELDRYELFLQRINEQSKKRNDSSNNTYRGGY